MAEIASGCIPAQLASKANSRRMGRRKNGKPFLIKSASAMAFMKAAGATIRKLPTLYEGHVSVTARCWYVSKRSDLDTTLLMDALQGRIIKNDRQVVAYFAFMNWDKTNPRVEWTVREAA